MERCRTALSERDSWRMRAEQKYAMRRELEELLGVDRNDASDEQFQKGLDAIKNIIRERNEAIQRRMETILQCELLEKERDRLRQLLVADSERVDAYLGVCTERDEARHEIQGWKNKFNCAVEMGARAENESEEQARLLGMSAEREESVRGKLFLAERELARLKAAAKEVVKVWETPPWKIGETPSNAITQLRDTINYED
jgi:hypothetical protein